MTASLKDLPKIFESATIQPSFKIVHVLLALIIFEEETKIGRYRLKKELNLPEGKVKSLLNRMKKPSSEGGLFLIKMDSRISGHEITQNGKEMLQELYEKITPPKEPEFNYQPLAIADYCYYSLVRNASNILGSGIDQRDEAIKIGGSGATCLVYQNNKFHFPEKNAEYNIDIDSSQIPFGVNNGDVLVIGTAKDKGTARLATLSASLSLAHLFD